jgi:hypothetical protein
MRAFARAALFAVPIAVVLAMFVQACGAVHGAPSCGPSSAIAVPIVVFALVVEGFVFPSPQSDLTIRLLIIASSYLVAFVLCLCVLYLASLARRR